MRYLLDTHIILWALANDKRLSDEVKEVINDTNNEIFYSTISPWEVEIKHLKYDSFKLSGEQLIFLCNNYGLHNIQISNEHIEQLKKIKEEVSTNHNDPFDKMLLAQSLSENMTFVTHDKKFKSYNFSNVMIV